MTSSTCGADAVLLPRLRGVAAGEGPYRDHIIVERGPTQAYRSELHITFDGD